MSIALDALQPLSIVGAPGNTMAILLDGVVGTPVVTLAGQGTAQDLIATIPATFSGSANPYTCLFTVPDGVAPGLLTVTNGDASTVALPFNVVSQYVTAAEYSNAGEGTDLSSMAAGYAPGAPGELDQILRRASTYVDTFVGFPLRQRPITQEQHAWRSPLENARLNTRVYPFCWPVRLGALDQFIVRISTTQYASFGPDDIVINTDQRYLEILSYAVASYTLLGAIQNLGLVANIVELYYTAGYTFVNLPQNLKAATTMIATELISYRAIQQRGFGGLSSVKEGQAVYQRRDEPFGMPLPAKELLRPYMSRVIR